MITFSYQARDPLGNTHSGNVEANSREEAIAQLGRDGLQVLSMAEEAAAGPGLFARGVTRIEIIYITNQLAVMIDTGITISASLQCILEQEKNPTLKAMLVDLKTSVESGVDFSSALAKYPKHFDKTYVSLIKASEATGSLGAMLQRISEYQRKEVEMRGKVKSSMAYPIVMLVLAIGVTLFLLMYVLPQFSPLFTSKGIKLPGVTKFLMKASDGLLDFWYAWLVGIVAVVFGITFAKKTEKGRQFFDWMKISAPLIGQLNRKVVISRSIRTLGTLLGSGIPMLDSLRLSAEVAGNVFYEQLWAHVQDQVTSGAQICESLKGSPLFPAMLIQMISAGEQTGKLGPVLERVSDYYDNEVDNSIKAVTSMIEPIMITVMGVIVGTIAMGLLMPIFSLSSAKGG